jgi:MFS family permease
MVDVKSRRWIVAIGISIWCLMTVACGFAKTFGQLFVARCGVGMGEASLSPAAASLISDSFPSQKRALAFSVYHLGYPVGGGLALIIGGAIIDALAGVEIVQLGLLGEFKPWQLAFIIVGLPGLVMAALMFTFTEPARQGLAKDTEPKSIPISEVVDYVRERWKAYFPLIGGIAMLGMLALGTAIWYPTFLIRTYGLSPSEAGYSYGLVMGICGVAGILSGGVFSQYLSSRGYLDANLRTMLCAATLKTVPLIVGPLMPTVEGALAVMAVGTFLGQVSVGVSTASVQDITPNQMRGQITALMFFLVTLIGLGFGATFIAILTDFVFKDDNALRYSISLASAIVAPTVCLMFFFGLKHFRANVLEQSPVRTAEEL